MILKRLDCDVDRNEQLPPAGVVVIFPDILLAETFYRLVQLHERNFENGSIQANRTKFQEKSQILNRK